MKIRLVDIYHADMNHFLSSGGERRIEFAKEIDVDNDIRDIITKVEVKRRGLLSTTVTVENAIVFFGCTYTPVYDAGLNMWVATREHFSGTQGAYWRDYAGDYIQKMTDLGWERIS